MAAFRAECRPAFINEKEGFFMKENHHQCIHCSVTSCKHLNATKNECSLDAITVAPKPMAYSGNPADESMCQSYCCK